MATLLGENWDFHLESLSEIQSRYTGYGCHLFDQIQLKAPTVFKKLKFYRSINHQPEDVFAIYEDSSNPFAIQLDPESEHICLWNEHMHVELGYWCEDVYQEAITIITHQLLT
ncbi:hypothetical protein CHH28_03750 [Bacterioplanes sanyensis]|uniref:Uncharacterized protein n=1 Tax=Bacterioplanes sanyensis TaxID=1249553 RepID=A0A222FHE4_9GAMM|nr:hypothetical protein [Bacterioplanes sanyensis]ASP37841.1 hypothetical protein CHH28_03750 [Bacterioplanes sanyensis]